MSPFLNGALSCAAFFVIFFIYHQNQLPLGFLVEEDVGGPNHQVDGTSKAELTSSPTVQFSLRFAIRLNNINKSYLTWKHVFVSPQNL